MNLPLLEFLFALFLVIGPVKSFLHYFKVPLPFDMTAMVSVLLVLLVGASILIKGLNPRIDKVQIRSILFLGLFISWNALSLLYTVSPQYSYEKLNQLILLGGCFLIPVIVPKIDPVMVIRFYCLILFPLAILFCREMYVNYIASYNEEYRQFQGNYLALSELVGFSLVCISERWWILPRKSLQLPFLVFGVFLMLLLGARGPFIFVIGCWSIRVLIEVFYGRLRMQPKVVFRSIALLGVSALLLTGVYFSNSVAVERLFERTLSRFSQIGSEFGQEESMGSETMSRLDLIDRAMDYSFESVGAITLGQGIGGFGIRYFGVDQRAYPHNIFLEILVETGIVGLILFLCFFVSSIFSIYPRAAISPIVILFCLGNALKSHTIVDLRGFFAALAIATLPVLIHESRNNKNERVYENS